MINRRSTHRLAVGTISLVVVATGCLPTLSPGSVRDVTEPQSGPAQIVVGESSVCAAVPQVGGLTVSSSGTVYFSTAVGYSSVVDDRTRVYKVASGNLAVSLVAGNGVSGFAGDGAAKAAEFRRPTGLWIDSTGLFIADTGDNRVRKVNGASGVITTVAGNGHTGRSSNVVATKALLEAPTAVRTNGSGGLEIGNRFGGAYVNLTDASTDGHIDPRPDLRGGPVEQHLLGCRVGHPPRHRPRTGRALRQPHHDSGAVPRHHHARRQLRRQSACGVGVAAGLDHVARDQPRRGPVLLRWRRVLRPGGLRNPLRRPRYEDAAHGQRVRRLGDQPGDLGNGRTERRSVRHRRPRHRDPAPRPHHRHRDADRRRAPTTGTLQWQGDPGGYPPSPVASLAHDTAGDVFLATAEVATLSAGYRTPQLWEIGPDGSITAIQDNGGPVAGDKRRRGTRVGRDVSSIEQLAVDPAGDLFIADGPTVRRVDHLSHQIDTIAGNGSEGNTGDGGPATAAELRNVRGLTADATGNVYIGEATSHVATGNAGPPAAR